MPPDQIVYTFSGVEVVFDTAKAVGNLAKHGLDLALAATFDFKDAVIVIDDRNDYGEVRYRAFARIDGEARCLVFTSLSTRRLRAMSYRRAHEKEMKRYGL